MCIDRAMREMLETRNKFPSWVYLLTQAAFGFVSRENKVFNGRNITLAGTYYYSNETLKKIYKSLSRHLRIHKG